MAFVLIDGKVCIFLQMKQWFYSLFAFKRPIYAHQPLTDTKPFSLIGFFLLLFLTNGSCGLQKRPSQ